MELLLLVTQQDLSSRGTEDESTSSSGPIVSTLSASLGCLVPWHCLPPRVPALSIPVSRWKNIPSSEGVELSGPQGGAVGMSVDTGAELESILFQEWAWQEDPTKMGEILAPLICFFKADDSRVAIDIKWWPAFLNRKLWRYSPSPGAHSLPLLSLAWYRVVGDMKRVTVSIGAHGVPAGSAP